MSVLKEILLRYFARFVTIIIIILFSFFFSYRFLVPRGIMRRVYKKSPRPIYVCMCVRGPLTRRRRKYDTTILMRYGFAAHAFLNVVYIFFPSKTDLFFFLCNFTSRSLSPYAFFIYFVKILTGIVRRVKIKHRNPLKPRGDRRSGASTRVLRRYALTAHSPIVSRIFGYDLFDNPLAIPPPPPYRARQIVATGGR